MTERDKQLSEERRETRLDMHLIFGSIMPWHLSLLHQQLQPQLNLPSLSDIFGSVAIRMVGLTPVTSCPLAPLLVLSATPTSSFRCRCTTYLHSLLFPKFDRKTIAEAFPRYLHPISTDSFGVLPLKRAPPASRSACTHPKPISFSHTHSFWSSSLP